MKTAIKVTDLYENELIIFLDQIVAINQTSNKICTTSTRDGYVMIRITKEEMNRIIPIIKEVVSVK